MSSELSHFLQTRRARLTPADVGLPERGPRRVPGLRREEVAQLAGVSTDYYQRLEQGRSAHVSEQVLMAVGRALLLDATEQAHLHNLARPQVRRSRTRKSLRGSLHSMLKGMPEYPALIVDHATVVLAANTLARSVFGIGDDDRSRDRARHFFLDPESREFFPQWPQDALALTAELRVQTARRPDDPRLIALVGELSIKSDDFRALWAKHPVKDKTHGSKLVNHPLVGELELSYDRLTLAADDNASLYVYTAEPGSPTSERLALLASWSSSPDVEAERADSATHRDDEDQVRRTG